MNITEAKEECNRWFAYLDKQRARSRALQKLASDRRAGRCDDKEMRRRRAQIDESPTVYDGAELEKAIRVILKNI